MDPKASLARPRRILMATLMFVLLSGVGLGMAGAGEYAEADPASPPQFTFAAPMAGDRGRYELEFPGTSEKDSILALMELRSLDFQWLSDEATHDADGRPVLSKRVRLVD